ncbi:MAG TPA: DUF1800 domain-containing protein [Verrucomicrobiota bacterium]|nr:DUF1800 domain-containing protein [Verrucomicrobiota bacterium]
MLKPLSASKWNYTTAAHLLNRAGFGGPPAQIEELVALGPEKSVSLLLDYEKIPDPTPDPEWARPDPTRMAALREMRSAPMEEKQQMQKDERQLQRQRMMKLRGWWFGRMASGPRPLQEKMVLFWHGHFATSVEKVRDAYYMWRQNELFRRLATGNWQQLLTAVAKDPAMLIWLDQAQSRKNHPNENFAREVMELFALGEGHYTEKDITEAARALTGWSLNREEQSFVDRPRIHDTGEKTFLGKTGNLDGNDVIAQIVAQPQAARFISAKLWNYFAGEAPSDELNSQLAAVFRKSGNNFKPLLRVMFASEEFYSPSVVRNQVKSPVQWLVGSVRVLEMQLPPPIVCWGMTRNLGQDLFAPPNVKGWDGGVTWITTNNLLARYNQAAALVQGDYSGMSGANFAKKPGQGDRAEKVLKKIRPQAADVGKIFTEKERTDKTALVAALEKRLLQSKLKEKQARTLQEFLDSQGQLDDGDILTAIRLVMSTPEYQLT